MASVLFKAIGRGYSARSILRTIGQKSPQYADKINSAYYAGYAAQDILSRLASTKDNYYPPEMFMTEDEKAYDTRQRQKRNNAMMAIGAAGTAGAAFAGLYSYLNRNAARMPDEIIIPGKKQIGVNPKGKNAYTIHRGRPQIENKQRQIAYDQKKIGYENKGKGPHKRLPFYPIRPSSPQDQNLPQNQPEPPPQYKNVNPSVFDLTGNSPLPPTQEAPKEKPYFKTYNMLKNIKTGAGKSSLDENIIPMIRGGMTNPEIEIASEFILGKKTLSMLDKVEGGFEKVLNDLREYVQDFPENKKENKFEDQTITPINTQKSQSLQEQPPTIFQKPPTEQPIQNQVQQPTITPQIQPMQRQNEPMVNPQQDQQISPIMSPQFNEPISEVQRQLNTQNEGVEPEKASRQVQTNTGESGDLIDVKNGVATVNVDGKEKKFKFSDLETAPENVEKAIRTTLNSIPEKLKSTNLMGTVHIPGINMMVVTFYSGRMVWYKHVPLERYNKIVFSETAPKGEAITGIASYNPNSADSRGAEYNIFKRDAMYSKENEGVTWGYIDNKYNVFDYVQEIIHKVSKERYDKSGNLIIQGSKPRKSKK